MAAAIALAAGNRRVRGALGPAAQDAVSRAGAGDRRRRNAGPAPTASRPGPRRGSIAAATDLAVQQPRPADRPARWSELESEHASPRSDRAGATTPRVRASAPTARSSSATRPNDFAFARPTRDAPVGDFFQWNLRHSARARRLGPLEGRRRRGRRDRQRHRRQPPRSRRAHLRDARLRRRRPATRAASPTQRGTGPTSRASPAPTRTTASASPRSASTAASTSIQVRHLLCRRRRRW